ncbi:uncharacterized protein at4g06744 [Phtheirospermum japonicum]|uniref:Uncharacterized protein at4g06744 n=1 Tax=Phtheirospermum japonicum TaxID=374723 RepID=A0A830B728_9LAMI|nr:uncharacterized protein at4g06744 [Phtheirospermum japonicum]
MKTFIFSTILLISLDFKSLAQIPKPVVQVPLPPAQVPPLIFADLRLALVYPIIQKFKTLITSDPFNITATWIGSDICRYKGFYCEAPPDNESATAVASVDFNGFQLSSPTIVGFLDQLPDIAIFHANSNDFSGLIPPNLSNLPYLYELDISNNKFSGPFPPSILGMDGLSYLDLRFNFFTGSIPPEIFARDIDFLFLNNNNFMTRLPDNIGPDTNILYLTLANNKFFGPIPRGISRALSGLTEILLLNNLLTGCLPYELGLLKDAVVFDAGNNNLTGPLPFSLGCLQNLEVLNLAGNMLYGNIPEIICGLGKLANLSVSDNYFMRIGPVCMGLIKSGALDVRKNCIPGQALQRPMAECAAFFARPRYCPYSDTFSRIPCWLPQLAPGLAPSYS